MFLNEQTFPFVPALETGASRITEELKTLAPEKFLPWHEHHLYTHQWRVLGLYAFGEPVEKNCRLCPATAAILRSIPGIYNAGFSSLLPGTRIKPHRGYTRTLLRCHLGLMVPDGCGLKVAGETRRWQEGRCLVFDDTSMHEAWNEGIEERVVLLVDFLRPGAAFTFLDRMKIGLMKRVARRYLK